MPLSITGSIGDIYRLFIALILIQTITENSFCILRTTRYLRLPFDEKNLTPLVHQLIQNYFLAQQVRMVHYRCVRCRLSVQKPEYRH